jgi:hypothetical protein
MSCNSLSLKFSKFIWFGVLVLSASLISARIFCLSESLQVRKRLEYAHQENIGRSKRPFVKKSDYWEKEIFSLHSAKRQNNYLCTKNLQAIV